MTLPETINSGDTGHIGHHEELHAFANEFEGWTRDRILTAGRMMIAADDSPQAYKDHAVVVCAGEDDHTAVNVLQAVIAGLGFGGIDVAPGTYHAGGSLVLADRSSFCSMGRYGAKWIADELITGGLIVVNGSASPSHYRHMEISGIELNGGDTATPLLVLDDAASMHLERLQFGGTDSDGIRGRNWWDSTIYACRFDGCGTVGAASRAAVRAGVRLYSTATGDFDNCNGLDFLSCVWENTPDAPADSMFVAISGGGGDYAHSGISIIGGKGENRSVSSGYAPFYFEGVLGLRVQMRGTQGAFRSGGPTTPAPFFDVKDCTDFEIDPRHFETVAGANSLRCAIRAEASMGKLYIPRAAVAADNEPSEALIEFVGSANDIDIAGGHQWSYDPDSTAKMFSGWPGTPRHRGIARKSTSTTRTVTTASADPHLVLRLQAGGRYKISAQLHYEAGASAGLQFGLSLPAGASADWSWHGPGSNYAPRDESSMAAAEGFGGSGRVIFIEGTVIMGTTPGNMAISWAKALDSADDATLLAPCWLEAVVA